MQNLDSLANIFIDKIKVYNQTSTHAHAHTHTHILVHTYTHAMDFGDHVVGVRTYHGEISQRNKSPGCFHNDFLFPVKLYDNKV